MKLLFVILLLICMSISCAADSNGAKLSSGEVSVGLAENMGQCLVASGDALHVVWSDTIGGDGIYYTRSADEGVTWGKPVRLSPTPSADGYPYLACSGKYVHLVFIRHNNTPDAASYYKRSTDGGRTWGADVELGKTTFWPAVAASGDTVYAALETRLATGISQVYFMRSTDNGATWSARQQVSNGANRSEDPAIAASGDNVYMVWNDNRSGVMEAMYRRSTDRGATWGAEMPLTKAPSNEYTPTVIASGAEVDVAYADRGLAGRFHFDLYYLHSDDSGATWEPALQLTKAPDMGLYPQLARNGADVYLTWPGSLTRPGNTMFQHSGNGGRTWDPPESLTTTGAGWCFVTTTRHAVHAIWVDSRLGHNALYYTRMPLADAK